MECAKNYVPKGAGHAVVHGRNAVMNVVVNLQLLKPTEPRMVMDVMVNDRIPDVAGDECRHETQRVGNAKYENRNTSNRPPHRLSEQPRRSDECLGLTVVHQVSLLGHVLARTVENVAVQQVLNQAYKKDRSKVNGQRNINTPLQNVCFPREEKDRSDRIGNETTPVIDRAGGHLVHNLAPETRRACGGFFQFERSFHGLRPSVVLGGAVLSPLILSK